MTHRFAPQPRMPEFYVECGYMNDLAYFWKLRALKQTSAHGQLDIGFLGQWYHHRQALVHYIAMMGYNPANVSRDVEPCLKFMDALVDDWIKELSGGIPGQSLTTVRLQELEQYHRKLESVPGDKWEVKY